MLRMLRQKLMCCLKFRRELTFDIRQEKIQGPFYNFFLPFIITMLCILEER